MNDIEFHECQVSRSKNKPYSGKLVLKNGSYYEGCFINNDICGDIIIS
jgi:hypothetical protein